MICQKCLQDFIDFFSGMVVEHQHKIQKKAGSNQEEHASSYVTPPDPDLMVLNLSKFHPYADQHPWLHCHCGDLPETAKLGFEPYREKG